jgi:hypothetical protein
MSLTKTGSTLLTKLRVIPLSGQGPFATLLKGGAFTGPGDDTVASPAGSISVPDLVCVAKYTPTANDEATITAHTVGLATFDANSVPFPIKKGDLAFVATAGSVDSDEGVEVDPLTDTGLFVAGPAQIVVNNSTGASAIKVPVLNSTAADADVPADWLPDIYIFRYE